MSKELCVAWIIMNIGASIIGLPEAHRIRGTLEGPVGLRLEVSVAPWLGPCLQHIGHTTHTYTYMNILQSYCVEAYIKFQLMFFQNVESFGAGVRAGGEEKPSRVFAGEGPGSTSSSSEAEAASTGRWEPAQERASGGAGEGAGEGARDAAREAARDGAWEGAIAWRLMVGAGLTWLLGLFKLSAVALFMNAAGSWASCEYSP